jgi:LmbE family N-acetylglucosaminyl deacetylase
MKILAVGAHPDDVEIFVFGSLLAWNAMGAEVTVAVAAGHAGSPALRPG